MHSFFGDPCVSAIAMSVAPRQGIARCTWLFFGVGAPTAFLVRPNVRAKLPAEAGAVSLVRDDAPSAADQAYSACRSGSA